MAKYVPGGFLGRPSFAPGQKNIDMCHFCVFVNIIEGHLLESHNWAHMITIIFQARNVFFDKERAPRKKEQSLTQARIKFIPIILSLYFISLFSK